MVTPIQRFSMPFNVSLSYNKSSNFQVTDTRRNVYGKPIDNPTGATKEYGILLSTKDRRELRSGSVPGRAPLLWPGIAA